MEESVRPVTQPQNGVGASAEDAQMQASTLPAPLSLALRRALLRCAHDFTALQEQFDAAELLSLAGCRTSARLTREMALIRAGFAIEGLAPGREMGPRQASIEGVALEEMARVFQVLDADTIASGRHEAMPRAPSTEMAVPDPETIESLCADLFTSLRSKPSDATVEKLASDLRAVRVDVLGRTACDLTHAGADIRDLAARLAFNNLRAFMATHFDLAYEPPGSATLFHAVAHFREDGLGAYGGGISRLMGTGRELIGWVQRAQQQGGGSPDPDLFEPALAALAPRADPTLLNDLLGDLGDMGLMRAVSMILDRFLRHLDGPPDRVALEIIRDAALDNDDLPLALRAQRLDASWWSGDKNEWLALGDILAYGGDYGGAAEAFERALRLQPDDHHATHCLAALADARHDEFVNKGGFGTPPHRKAIRAQRRDEGVTLAVVSPVSTGGIERLAPELLPKPEQDLRRELHDGVHLFQIGARRVRSRWGPLPALGGVEAIRGFCVSAVPILEMRVSLGARTLWRDAPIPAQTPPDPAGRRKYVFNAWIDVSQIPVGRYELELTFVDLRGDGPQRREHVLIVEPLSEAEHPSSDAVVSPPVHPEMALDEEINARPSIIRPAGRSLFDAPPANVLVIRPDQLGDLACSVPALRRLREILPEARLTGLVNAGNERLARTLAVFDDVVTMDFPDDPIQRRRVMSLADQERLRCELHARHFDLAIDLSEIPPSRPLLLLSGARHLYGCGHRDHPYLTLSFDAGAYDEVNGSIRLPATSKALGMVEWLGLAMKSHAEVAVRADLDGAALDHFGLRLGRYAVLHTGARLAFSRWPHFRDLADLFLQRTDLDVVVITDGSAGDAGFPESGLRSRRLRIIKGELAFDVFDSLLSFCAVFVGNDSGPKHLAALRGAKVVSIHCARNNWDEWGQELGGFIIGRRVPCAGCQIGYDAEECGKGFVCITRIEPEEVFGAAMRSIGPAGA